MTRKPTHEDPTRKVKGLEKTFDERKEAEEALRESEKRYRAVVEDMPAMICRFLPDGVLTFVNSFFCSFFMKYKDELIGSVFFDLIPEKEREKFKNICRSLDKKRPTIIQEYEVVQQDGTPSWQEWTYRALFDENDRLIEYQAIGRDITVQKVAREERNELERQLYQAQKIEAIGTLAGGIAHDFNNILSAVIGHSELAMLYLPKKTKARQNLKKILSSAYRARKLVNLIQTISLESEAEPKPVQIHMIVNEALKLLRASLPATIDIRPSIAVASDTVLCDPGHIHQVIMNLCTNALHAMRDSGGTLSIALNPEHIDARTAEKYADLHPGPYVKLTVSDTGQGMNQSTIDRIFDPYFTTKEMDIGTGLGLAVVHGIVKSYGGKIQVFSESGKGTTFEMLLPRMVEDTGEEADEYIDLPQGHERILFIDDEEMLVDLSSEMLKKLGYRVESTTNPIRGVEIFRKRPDRFDLVITDMTMPQITGDELAVKLMKIKPDIPIILCTGYNERISEEKAKKLGIRAFQMKPLVMRELAAKIREVLAGKTS
ncbi:MAG: ATP-binding protein [Desulfobacterales bacterium]|jgi:PAS domain S-box-containing protein